MTETFFPAMHGVAEPIRQAEHLLLGLDYDGTLTPIVDDPALALLSKAMRQLIWALTQRDDITVALISGRAQADLQKLVGIPGAIYAGNHGLEISGPGVSYLEPTARAAMSKLHALGQDLAKKIGAVQGAFVEDKGLTLSVHHRRVAPVDAAEVCRVVHQTVATHEEFHITLGDKVYEVRPRVSWNKGSAVSWIKMQLGKPDTLVIYVGDDATDEDAFQSLGDGAVTIRVGDLAATSARFLLPDPATVQHFLEWILELRSGESGALATGGNARNSIAPSGR